MDRVKVNQRYLNKLPVPTDMPDVPWIQWRVENVEELVRFLEDFEVDIRRVPGDQVIIRTPVLNSDIQLSPGDCLVIVQQATPFGPRPRLGVVRAERSVPIREGDDLPTHKGTEFLRPNNDRVTHSLIIPDSARRTRR